MSTSPFNLIYTVEFLLEQALSNPKALECYKISFNTDTNNRYVLGSTLNFGYLHGIRPHFTAQNYDGGVHYAIILEGEMMAIYRTLIHLMALGNICIVNIFQTSLSEEQKEVSLTLKPAKTSPSASS